MKVLFIGGTGLISAACSRLAVERGIALHVLTRGGRPRAVPAGATPIVADVNRDPEGVAAALAGHDFDAVVDWIVFTPEQLRRDVELFRGVTSQYVFISSASAYLKPVENYLVREDTPLANPYWGYARSKIAAEQELLDAVEREGFPGTIVRPSLTYGDSQIPLAINSWQKPYTAIRRMREGRPVIVPGDGTSLWTVTHNSDFAKGLVGLLGNPATTGEAFHITSDEVLTWDRIYRETARAAGVEPRLAHIASDFIAACLPAEEGNLLGDKAVSAVFDNEKIKRFVPGFEATTSFAEGIARTLAWFDADDVRQEVDEGLDRVWNRMLAAYAHGLDTARKELGR